MMIVQTYEKFNKYEKRLDDMNDVYTKRDTKCYQILLITSRATD